MHSEIHCPTPERMLVENCNSGISNIACVTHTPITPPVSCAQTYAASKPADSVPARQNVIDTTGLKYAPETGANIVISTYKPAPVAMEFPSKATAELPPDSFSPMMPEPTTTASNSAVPTNSAAIRCVLVAGSIEVSAQRKA